VQNYHFVGKGNKIFKTNLSNFKMWVLARVCKKLGTYQTEKNRDKFEELSRQIIKWIECVKQELAKQCIHQKNHLFCLPIIFLNTPLTSSQLQQ